MDTRGKQLGVSFEMLTCDFKQNLSHIFICNDTIVLQACRPTRTDENMAACFPRVPCMRSSQGTQGTRDSECLNLRYLKDSETKTMAFQCEGCRYEWRFVKHQRTDDLPKSVWRWTAIANRLARFVSTIFNFMRCWTPYCQALDLCI